MALPDQNELNKLLADSGLYAGLFDVTRIVDARAGKLVEVKDGKAIETRINCFDILGCNDQCKNCTSTRALYSGEQIVKLEYAGGSVFLIVSVPVVVDGRPLVVELIKDITKSMTVDLRDDYRADEVSVIIDNFNRLATTDQQTSLMNRRFIDEHLPGILSSSRKIGKPVSLAMVDIDFFKQVNDRHGHQAGDTVLADLAKELMAFIRRDSDFAARYGGEEFLLCFPGIPRSTCREVCERLRQAVENRVFVHNGAEIRITVSIGVAESGECADPTQEAVIALADQRLYQAKASGRNMVV